MTLHERRTILKQTESVPEWVRRLYEAYFSSRKAIDGINGEGWWGLKHF